jgi:hypothetical protein
MVNIRALVILVTSGKPPHWFCLLGCVLNGPIKIRWNPALLSHQDKFYWKTKSTVFVSPDPTVIFCILMPNFSCHACRV